MKNFFSYILTAYRAYREVTRRSRLYKIYRISSYSFTGIALVYVLILAFPQFLFASHVKYGRFDVYSRQPLNENLNSILDEAETRLARSPIYDGSAPRQIFLADSHGLYAFFSNKAYNSFGSTVPLINNIMVNRSDIAADAVYVNRAERNRRSLSGLIAHEVTHHFIRQKFGVARSMFSIPAWKNEGYCEYVAGDGSTSFEDGVRLWKETRGDATKHSYFKSHQMVKYLLDDEKISVEDLFNHDFDIKELEAKVLAKISGE